ncbi:hypothetical protein ACFU96_19735 [Streptomyces sp. NPDC057620]|uniref:hypothetical protein n=1 Tax=Streptomyces sp. NPDC057620 TaxID=3346185 RepID=UPI003685EBD3
MESMSNSRLVQEEAWKAPFMRFADYIEETGQLVEMAYTGMQAVISLHEVFGIIEEGREVPESRISNRKEQVKLAQRQIDSKFRLLHGHAIMGTWGSLECLIEDVVEAWMAFKPEVLRRQEFEKIKIPLAKFLGLSDDQRVRLLVSEIQRDLKLDLRSGVTKFEKLLDAVGLGGPVDPRLRDTLYEFQNVRNVLAHRAGIVDQRFVDACPSYGLQVGERVAIDEKSFTRLHNGVYTYSMVLINRILASLGRDIRHVAYPGFEGATQYGIRANHAEVKTEPVD